MQRLNWKHFDFWLFGAVVILSIFGVAMIRSAIAGNAVLADFAVRQSIFLLIGLFMILLLTVIDYRYWASLTKPAYAAIVALLLVLFAIGQTNFGATRWIQAGIVNIQPAELAKMVLILVLADYFARNQDKPHDIMWIVHSLKWAGGIAVCVFLQPNLSMTIVLMVLWFTMLWISGLEKKYLVMFVVVGIVGIILLVPQLEQYQIDRVMNFLMPSQEEANYGERYNVDQALITIGSGGWFGMGYGHGSQVQLRFLKVRHTDFIFAAMAEEFGFVGTVAVVLLLLFVVSRCFRAARLASDTFGGLIAFGFGVQLLFQMAVNIGVNLQVIPVTGLTLPFISYGGSSVLSLTLGIGLVESVIMRHKPLEF